MIVQRTVPIAATSHFLSFGKHKIHRKLLLDSKWAEVGSVSELRMDGACVVWFDDQETKAWILGGRTDQLGKGLYQVTNSFATRKIQPREGDHLFC